jgi:hypothetical protein
VQQVELLKVGKRLEQDVVWRLDPNEGERLELAQVQPAVDPGVNVPAGAVVQARVDLNPAVIKGRSESAAREGGGGTRSDRALQAP